MVTGVVLDFTVHHCLCNREDIASRVVRHDVPFGHLSIALIKLLLKAAGRDLVAECRMRDCLGVDQKNRRNRHLVWLVGHFLITNLLPAPETHEYVGAPGVVTVQGGSQVPLVSQVPFIAHQGANIVSALQSLVELAEKHRRPDVEVVIVYHRYHVKLFSAAQFDVFPVDLDRTAVGVSGVLPMSAKAIDVTGHVNQVTGFGA